MQRCQHVQVGDRACDQRQQRHASDRRPPDPGVGPPVTAVP
jgi:hypothetical protein